jgi:hypothetical protein
MTYLHKLTLPQVLTEWDKIDEHGTNICAIRALCLIDRFYLMVKVLKRVDMLHPWLYARVREVEQNTDGYLDLWAREHYKSTIITFAGTIQEILKNPEITIGIFSHTKGIAGDFLLQIKKEMEGNEILHAAFPDILYSKNEVPPSGTWNMEKLTVKRKTNPKEASVESHGLVDGMPTGKHFELMIYDDVVTSSSVATPEQIAKTTAAWSLSDNLGARPETGLTRKWHIGTRYSYADTYQTMLERKVVKPRIYPATHNGTPEGKPVLLTPEQWEMKLKTQSPSDIACQMLQDPISGQEKMFDVEDVQLYEVRPNILNVYILVDPARSKKVGSDNTAIAVIGVDRGLRKYLLDGINHRCDLQERWQWLRKFYLKWHPDYMEGVQAIKVGYEAFGALADLDYFREQMRDPRNPKFDIEELKWPREGGGSKKDRVQRLTPDFRQHKFFTPYPTPVSKNNITGEQEFTLTDKQELVARANYAYRISKRIIQRDSDGKFYDLAKHFMQQVNFFPHGKVDLIDAVARIYDMEIAPPFISVYDEDKFEPEFT